MSCHPFDLLMELGTDFIRLDCAALHLARDFYPKLSLTPYLARLDELAARVAELRPGLSAPLRYQALREVLVGDAGLRGTEADFDDPEAAFMNRVLDTGRGLPISLGMVWIEVGRRLKWPVAGVGLPGHFLVRVDDEERFVAVDPFCAGRSLSIADCRRLVQDTFGRGVRFTSAFLQPIGTRAVLLRLLRTLRNMYLNRNDLQSVAQVLRRMAAVDPANSQHLQEMAAVCCRRGDVRGAAAHLELYLHRAPHARDSKVVRRNLRQLKAALLALN